MKIDILEMTHEHIDGVSRVERESFSIPWSEKSFIDELNNPVAKYFVALYENSVAGYVGMWEVGGQCDITNIAVLPHMRRTGIGRYLLQYLIDYCQNKSLSPITLEVRESNTVALKLYSSFGFEAIGRRTKYYADTGEDALILSLNL